MFVNNMKIGTRITVGVGLIVLMMAACTVVVFLMFEQFSVQLDKIVETQNAGEVVAQMVAEAKNNVALGEWVLMSIASAAILFGLWVGYLLWASIVRPIKYANKIADRISDDDLSSQIVVESTDEAGHLLDALKIMQQKLSERIEAIRTAGAENQRIRVALDHMTSFVMVTDEDCNIIFINSALKEFFKKYNEQIDCQLGNFSSQDLLGKNMITTFQEVLQDKAVEWKNVTTIRKDRILCGDRNIDLILTPVITKSGELIGNSIEWSDMTDQLEAERQVQSLIDKAVLGVLDERISAESFDGFMCKLSSGINDLLEAVVNPIQEAVEVSSALANNDLRMLMGVGANYQGDFSKLSDSINGSMVNLQTMVGEIRRAAHSINGSAGEIASGTSDLSQRTQEQAASIEETAASMEEMTSTVRQNADNALQADTLAAEARKSAEQGGTVLKNAITSMSEISESSHKIADIIGVIDGIAFQTNLLALNAAVEAARAGEQGRGFAVVAGEVRNLAQRSAEAAREIKELIEDSVLKVEEGSKLVQASGSSLSDIVVSVQRVGDIIAEIASASKEQTLGIEQVNMAITQMDTVTQQNAALVEETAASSVDMDSQAGAMLKLTDVFKVD
jgi:methyl-accepting chemotaxis protein